jgi:hypothetical protein
VTPQSYHKLQPAGILHDTPTETHRFRDSRVTQALKELRRVAGPEARPAIDRLVERLRYIDKILTNWDRHHAKIANAHIDAGRFEAASLVAWLVWDDESREGLLAKFRLNVDTGEAEDRISAAIAAGREVGT